jgi:endonuclease III
MAPRSRFSTWDEVAAASEDEIVQTILDGAFARQKARWIKESLRLLGERGELSLDFLSLRRLTV